MVRTAINNRIQVRDFRTALNFDGSSSGYATANFILNVYLSGTMACWVKFGPQSANANIMKNAESSSRRFGITTGATGTIRAGFYNGSSYVSSRSSTKNYADDRWHFCLATWNGTITRLYVDGVWQVGTTQPAMSAAAWFILSGDSLRKKITQAMVWTRVITDTEADNIFYKNIIPRDSLASEWLLNDCVGTDAVDSSGNANTLTLQGGATWTTDTPSKLRRYIRDDGHSIKFSAASDIIGLPITETLKNYLFESVAMSPDINVHQGITTDGTYYYAFHTSMIIKYDLNWVEVARNANVNTECGNSHLGDGHYDNGKLYVPTDDFVACGNFGTSKISVWDATTLAYIGTHDISAQGHEVAGLVVDGANDLVYVVSYCDGTKIWKYKLSDFSYVGTITLSVELVGNQGIAKKGDYFYINKASKIYKVGLDGTVLDLVYVGANEGIDYSGDYLLALDDVSGSQNVYFLKPRLDYGITVALSIKPDKLPQEVTEYNRMIQTTDDYLTLYYDYNDDTISFKCLNYGAEGTRPSYAGIKMKKNRWQDVVVTWSPTYCKMYIDGILVSSKTREGLGLISNFAWKIGATDQGYKGLIDNVRFWSRPLSQQEITDLYCCNKVSRDRLMAEYLFNEGSGSAALDTSENANDGTITGATYSTDVDCKARTEATARVKI